jgi:hypothetical protein
MFLPRVGAWHKSCLIFLRGIFPGVCVPGTSHGAVHKRRGAARGNASYKNSTMSNHAGQDVSKFISADAKSGNDPFVEKDPIPLPLGCDSDRVRLVVREIA